MKRRSDPSVIIYDGDCRLCNRAVRFLKTEKNSEGFRFLPSSHPGSSETLAGYGIEQSVTEKTVILISENNIYTKSAAIIKALQQKGGLWILAGALFVIPRFIRDSIYDRIAEIRPKSK